MLPSPLQKRAFSTCQFLSARHPSTLLGWQSEHQPVCERSWSDQLDLVCSKPSEPRGQLEISLPHP